jgi:hypothetical protein
VSASATTLGRRLHATRLREAVASDVVVLTGLSVLVVLLTLLTWHTWGDLNRDTGYDLEAGFRVAHGGVPYRDFTYFYGPLAPALSGLAVLVGGDSFGSLAALGLLITAAILACTYALARCYLAPLAAGIATGITAAVAFIPNNYSYVLPHTGAATLGTLFLLGLLLCLSRASAGADRWLVAAGLCVGLTTLTKPEVAGGAAAALAAWLLVRRQRRDALLAVAPAVAVPIAVYAPFVALAGFHRLVFENLYPVDFMRNAGSHLLRARMPLNAHGLAQLAGHTIVYALGAAAIVACGAAYLRPRLRLPVAVGVAIFALVLVAGSIADPDKLREAFYYFYGWIPVGAVVAVAATIVRARRRSGWTAATQLELAGAVALAVCAFTSFNFVFNGWRAQPAVYYAPLAAILLVRLHLVELARTRAAYALGLAWVVFLLAAGTGLTLKDARGESATVRGPGGALRATPADARLYDQALREIAANAGSGHVLLAPLLTALYGLSDRHSPLDQLSLIPGTLAAPRSEQRAIDELERSDTRLVITDRRTWPGYGHTSFGQSFDRRLAEVIRRDFRHVKTLHATGGETPALDVFIRRGQ